ncbi:MAG: FG-GAP repeat domain-containing protein, partial [Phycisphaerae bacterium]
MLTALIIFSIILLDDPGIAWPGLEQYGALQNCMSGDSMPASLGCEPWDGDGDGDVDEQDYFILTWQGIFPEPVMLAEVGDAHLEVLSDLDHDGWLDVVHSNYDDDEIIIRWGNGRGDVSEPVSFPGGGSPSGIADYDVDADGDQDLLVANRLSDTITFLINNGDRTFALGDAIMVGETPMAVAYDDFTADNIPDLLTINCSSSELTLLINQGDGTFGAPIVSDVTFCPDTLRVGDFNNDGFNDVGVLSSSSRSFVPMINQGDGYFDGNSIWQGFCDAEALALGDIDGDNDLDAAVGVIGCQRIRVYTNDGHGVMSLASDLQISRQPRDLAIADVDGNGWGDLVLFHNGSRDGLTLYLNDGSGNFESQMRVLPDLPSGDDGRVIVDYFNFDPYPDIVVSSSSTGELAVVYGGDQEPRAPLLYDFASVVEIVPVNLDGDEDVDLVVGDTLADSVSVHFNLGDGVLDEGTEYPVYNLRDMVAGDFTGDEQLDYAVLTSNGARLFENNGSGDLLELDSVHLGLIQNRMASGDIDGDGDLDLLTHMNSGTNSIAKLINDGAGRFSAPGLFYMGNHLIAPLADDIDADGDLDFATSDYSLNEVRIAFNEGDDSFRMELVDILNDAPYQLFSVDLDGQDWHELVVVNRDDDNITIAPGGKDGLLEHQTYDVGIQPFRVAAVELTGDAHIDLAV